MPPESKRPSHGALPFVPRNSGAPTIRCTAHKRRCTRQLANGLGEPRDGKARGATASQIPLRLAERDSRAAPSMAMCIHIRGGHAMATGLSYVTYFTIQASQEKSRPYGTRRKISGVARDQA